MITRLFSTSPRFLACTRYLDMVWTPKQAFLARFLEFIQKPRGISLIAFSALLIFVTFVKKPPLLYKRYYNIRCWFYWLKKVATIPRDTGIQRALEGYLFPSDSQNCPTTKAIHRDNWALFTGFLLLWNCGWLLNKSQCAWQATVGTLYTPFLIYHALITLPAVYGTLAYKNRHGISNKTRTR